MICIKIYGANSQRLNCQSSFKMFMTLLLKNLSCFNQKYVNGSKTKSFQSNVITLVRGHICSFYKLDRSLDFILVVYNLIELIIETSY